jgi:hypothetical protein
MKKWCYSLSELSFFPLEGKLEWDRLSCACVRGLYPDLKNVNWILASSYDNMVHHIILAVTVSLFDNFISHISVF